MDPKTLGRIRDAYLVEVYLTGELLCQANRAVDAGQEPETIEAFRQAAVHTGKISGMLFAANALLSRLEFDTFRAISGVRPEEIMEMVAIQAGVQQNGKILPVLRAMALEEGEAQ